MNGQGLLVAAINAVAVLMLAKPVGSYLARTFCGEPTRLGRALRPLEHGLCRLADVPSGPGIVKEPARMSWPSYLLSLLAFNGALVLIWTALRQGSVLLSGRTDQAAALALVASAQRLIRLFASAATGLTLVNRAHARAPQAYGRSFWELLGRSVSRHALPAAAARRPLGAVARFAGSAARARGVDLRASAAADPLARRPCWLIRRLP